MAVGESWGCCDKAPRTGCCKQQNLLLPRIWRPEVPHQGVSRVLSPLPPRVGATPLPLPALEAPGAPCSAPARFRMSWSSCGFCVCFCTAIVLYNFLSVVTGLGVTLLQCDLISLGLIISATTSCPIKVTLWSRIMPCNLSLWGKQNSTQDASLQH